MIQETITYQDGTANNTQSTQPSKMKLIFEKVLKFKTNSIRRRNNKLKCQLEECNNKGSNSSLCSDTSEEDQNSQLKIASSSTKTLTSSSTSISSSSPAIIESQPIAPESTANSSTRSASLFSHFPWNYNSTLKHKSSSTSETSTSTISSVDKEKPAKKKKKLFSFSKREPEPINNWSINNNNYSNSTVSTSTTSIETSEQNDSAYETEIDNYSCIKKKEKKKGEKKDSKSTKKIRKTKLKTLSSKDEDYIEIKKFFQAGLPNKEILGIIRLQMPTKLVKAHEQYKKEMLANVANGENLSESLICHRMFHGTKTAFICKPQHFINNKCALFCKIGCGVCGIVQEGNRGKYSRYSQRMWFANSSATSLSYCSGNNVKAMFVVDVVSAIPNSILIIDKDEATIPRYLIVFQ